MRAKALPRAEELKMKLIEKYAKENEEKQVWNRNNSIRTSVFFSIENYAPP